VNEHYYRTSDLARAAGTHENTVRFYEQMGFLPSAGRGANGYRLWTRSHLDQMVFARRALHGLWPGRRIRASALSLVKLAAAEGPEAALPAALAHAVLVREERSRAEEAAAFLERWARGEEGLSAGDPEQPRLGPREAAIAVGATPGQIRNWERNRLLDTPREGAIERRSYGPAEIGRLRVIRALLLAGYSVMAILRMTRALDRGKKANLRGVLDTPSKGEEALTAFDRWLSSLDEQEERARGLIAFLSEWAEREKSLQ
jgi:DNA-binding transcriptional MerR regulator